MATGRVPTTANSPLTAKGDLFGYSTTQARVAVGNDGETLVADSSTSTGLRYQGNFAAGKNKIINGDFGIWQRGTSFSTSSDMYLADRFFIQRNNTNTISQQTFTPGTAPVSGYEGQYFLRYARTTVAGGADFFYQRIEDVRTFAGQTVTFSFWAKANTAIAIGGVEVDQIFGSGGSGTVTVTGTSSFSVTADWVRYSYTVALPSISGKTIGSGSHIRPRINFTGTAATFDTWGWQIEASNTATAFQTATGTLQGELAACQRYFTRIGGDTAYNFLANGYFDSSTTGFAMVNYSSMRTNPAATFTTASNFMALNVGTAVTTCTAISADFYTTKSFRLNFTVGSARTAGQGLIISSNNTTSGYIDISAEL